MSQSETVPPNHYHPAYAAIHWLMGLLIIVSLLIGTFILDPMPDNGAKVIPTSMHAIFGSLIGLLLIVRLVMRARSPRPAYASTGNPMMDAFGKIVHFLLYFGVLGMVISGTGIFQSANLLAVLQGQASFPGSFTGIPPRAGHGILGTMLLVLVIIHIGAALYHQFILKDNLFSRMSLKK